MQARPTISRSGRFSAGPAADLAQFSQSVSFDWRLWRQDLKGSAAHARMLAHIGVLSRSEVREILKHLKAIGQEIEDGRFEWRADLEDVHMNLEAALTRRTPAGAKLHSGRSRNDQVAVDMRLWVLDEIRSLQGEIRTLQHSLVDLGQHHADVLLPGYTHLQRAQPVFLAHHLLAYVEMFQRDLERLEDAADRTNVCPLGCGALAGSTLPLDRARVALELGFVDARGHPRLSQNSMDAVSDRDFVVEFCSAAALLAVHLSRLAEDFILWATREFGFVRLSDTYTTGSSLMPQKKNPDVAELARGKSARAIGNLSALLVLLKGLPMTYNRDLQEDKERLFDTADAVRTTTRILGAMIANSTIDSERCQQAASDPALLATDLAEALVGQQVPFREAHHIVGSVVAKAEKLGKPLDRLSLSELRSVYPGFLDETSEVFNLRRAMRRRNQPGAPGTGEVRRQLRRWQRLLTQ
jgi:argininosuccinate lyase